MDPVRGVQMRPWTWVVGICVACGGSAPEAEVEIVDPEPVISEPVDEEPPSACGETWLVDMEVSGTLVDLRGAAVVDADVWLEQRNWGPTEVHGDGVTAADGSFRFPVLGLPIVEGCWAIGPQFYAVADSGQYIGELGVNMQVVQGWQNGSLIADLSALLFVVDQPAAP